MDDPSDRFLEDLNNPEARNLDNEGLGAVHLRGGFVMGQVHEVNGPGAAEVVFMPTRHEAVQLAKYWFQVAIEIEYRWFLFDQVDSNESLLKAFAYRRVRTIAKVIGEVEVREANRQVEEELSKKNDPKYWKAFRFGTDQERLAVQEEIQRKLEEDQKD
jgi:hypothetical protein